MRVFIGDIQGCLHELDALLDEISFDPDRHQIYCVGDLVNRGPKSLKTLRFVRSLGKSAITVLGNHDLHLLALASGKKPPGDRFRTLQKMLNASDAGELIDWLRQRPLAHYDKSLNTLLVHAGTHPRWTAKKTLAHAAEVEQALRSDDYKKFLGAMYGNTPRAWSGKLKG